MASDFDQTLALYPRSIISARNAEAIRAVRDLGVHFAVISGRSTYALMKLLRKQDLDLGGLYVIGDNGAEVIQAWDGAVLANHRLDADLAGHVLTAAARFPVNVRVPEGSTIFAAGHDADRLRDDRDAAGATVTKVDDWRAWQHPALKIFLGGDRRDLEPVAGHLQREYGDHIEVAFSAQTIIEITDKGVTKGKALMDLCAATVVDPKRTVAFGDNQNDIPLLTSAGLGVAVANAIDSLKEVADRVTAAVDEDGVALVLEEIFALPV